mmetsp:Transcript_11301/g.15960  ORF Transcript_11301/g.15960 Transcript_11301/m.15960 type:complete len:530 (+) Transcript_11301:3-1592(+)|eukprot:CAMPEP_0184874216 /NCGR_PEP_ID=MMETSP0580-20130426/42268_1 /TAXON_ID=1118495 /ORGANISM="Dactyliosolen fragilissimus" /LENGTH=529 /DNA_ID=CAMNT_0027377197 /DNA_START=952 /DNA_END=2541 /DNA_ORIENTATION=+
MRHKDGGATNFHYNYNRAHLVDDASMTRKPDGYLRRLFHAVSSNTPNTTTSTTTCSNHHHVEQFNVAVDSPDEVRRIARTAKRFQSRINTHPKQNQNTSTNNIMPKMGFMLRLPTPKNNHGSSLDQNGVLADGIWEKLILAVHAAAVQEGGLLVGVSVNLAPWAQSLTTHQPSTSSTDDSNTSCKPDITLLEETTSNYYLNHVCTHLRLFRLLLISLGQYTIRIDLTGIPCPLQREHANILTGALASIVSSNVTMQELQNVYVHNLLQDGNTNKIETNINDKYVEETLNLQQILDDVNGHKNAQPNVTYTADASEIIVANAGALCARIIGVKKGKNINNTSSCNSQQTCTETSAKEKNDGEFNENKTATNKTKINVHYYIDDGCYGSLGSPCDSILPKNEDTNHEETCSNHQKRVHAPIPLYGGREVIQQARAGHTYMKKKPLTSIVKDSHPSNYVRATVWGPTCDGLDKVCESVMLPEDLEANRDWLVFPNLGCGGFGGGLGLGTAFNGFDPPDTAYCVLNYFVRGKE